MAECMKKMSARTIVVGIAVLVQTALYSYFIADSIMTKITDAQMTKVDEMFMIATEERPFVNYDAKYRFKFDSGTIQNDAIRLKGKMVRIKKYGWRVPILSWYENVVKIEEVEQR